MHSSVLSIGVDLRHSLAVASAPRRPRASPRSDVLKPDPLKMADRASGRKPRRAAPTSGRVPPTRLGRPVHCRPKPRHGLILPHLEDASGSLHPGADAPPNDEGVSERRIREVDRQGVIEHAARSRRRQPSRRRRNSVKPGGNLGMPWPSPPGGTPILIRTGKRRSADVIMSRGLPGICMFLVCSLEASRPCGAMSSGLGQRPTTTCSLMTRSCSRTARSSSLRCLLRRYIIRGGITQG